MAEFLSPEWITALDAAAKADEDLVSTVADVELVIEQHVGDGDDEIVYHLVFDHGTVRVAAGPADEPTVRFRQNRETAEAIARGELSAQRAFMSGRVQVGGDVQELVANSELLEKLGDTFASVRTDAFGPG